MICDLSIDGERFSLEVDGEFSWGPDKVLFERNRDTISGASWLDDGYTVVPLFNRDSFGDVRESLREALAEIVSSVTGAQVGDLDLRYYHELVDDEQHQKVIERTRFLDYSSFSIGTRNVCAAISEVLQREVGDRNDDPDGNIVILRISRPHSLDINPPHRDGYQRVWERTINVWIPIAGCERQSSLPIIPSSHYWNEKDVFRTGELGARINGRLYHVPAIAKTIHGLEFFRPNPQEGEALIFTPYLVHGFAINQLQDATRMSLELRLPVTS